MQGKRVRKDFNIQEKAGRAGKPTVETFNANVTDGTLEIRFQWAGKGTTSIPNKGIYGPLISAISIVDPSRFSIHFSYHSQLIAEVELGFGPRIVSQKWFYELTGVSLV